MLQQTNLQQEIKDAEFQEFVSFAHNYFPKYLYASDSLFHDWIKERFSIFHFARGQRQAIIAPRGSAKSTWLNLIYILYVAFYKIENFIIIISDTEKQAKIFLKRIKDAIVTNEELRKAFPATCRPWDVWQAGAIELGNGVRIEAVGKGGQIRGRVHQQYRPTLIILDDPQNLKDTYSEEQLEMDFDWLKSDVLKAGSENTNLIVLGTALAPKCIVCQLEKTPTWQHDKFKQLLSEPNEMHLWHRFRDILFNNEDSQKEERAKEFYLSNKTRMDEGSKVLWESRFPLYDVMINRFTYGERVFDQEEQGTPRVPGNAEFPPHYFERANFWFEQWPEGLLYHLWALDPSKGNKDKEGDYQALGRIGVDRHFTIFAEAWLMKTSISDLCELIFDKHRNNPGEAIVLETNGFQELLKIPLDHLSQQHKVDLPIFAAVHTTPKPVRIRRLDAPLSKGEIRFRRTPGTEMLVEQLQNFRVPLPKGQHDDGPDMLEMGIRIAKKLTNKKHPA